MRFFIDLIPLFEDYEAVTEEDTEATVQVLGSVDDELAVDISHEVEEFGIELTFFAGQEVEVAVTVASRNAEAEEAACDKDGTVVSATGVPFVVTEQDVREAAAVFDELSVELGLVQRFAVEDTVDEVFGGCGLIDQAVESFLLLAGVDELVVQALEQEVVPMGVGVESDGSGVHDCYLLCLFDYLYYIAYVYICQGYFQNSFKIGYRQD